MTIKFTEKWYLSRAIGKIYKTMMIYGSSHHQVSVRHRWNPMRFILGDFKYKFFHPVDIMCKCDWADCENFKAKK